MHESHGWLDWGECRRRGVAVSGAQLATKRPTEAASKRTAERHENGVH